MSESPLPAGARYDIRATAPRVTPPPAGRRFRQALGEGAGTLLRGVEGAASYVPGGTALTAAVRAAGSRGTAPAGVAPGGAAPEGPGAGGGPGTPEQALQLQADQSMYYLQLQEQMSAENRRFSTLSNVLKARHETAKAAINNIK